MRRFLSRFAIAFLFGGLVGCAPAAALAQTGEAEVKKYDKNGDDYVSREEAPPTWQPNFDAADTDDDGKISVAEVDAVLEKMRPDAQTGENVVKLYDNDHDGFVSREEAPPAWKPNFDAADTDDDGKISVAETDAVLKKMKELAGGADPPEGTQKFLNVAYVEGGHERQKLDVYVPPRAKGAKKKPKLIVWIHGGGWRAGSKENPPALFFLNEGYAVASLNYRFSEHAPMPAQIEDCKTAIRFLRAKADEYGYDASRIGVWGGSAGGHLVSLLGTSGDVKELDGPDLYADRSSRVQAVCNYFGPTDFVNIDKHMTPVVTLDWKGPDSLVAKLLGGPLADRQEEAKAASPITYVTKDDPPFLTLHGDMDALVPLGQAEALHEALEKVGVESELVVMKGRGHEMFLDPVSRAKVFAFFQRTLNEGNEQPASQTEEAPAAK
jgi:acetyl esterase/lipase